MRRCAGTAHRAGDFDVLTITLRMSTGQRQPAITRLRMGVFPRLVWMSGSTPTSGPVLGGDRQAFVIP